MFTVSINLPEQLMIRTVAGAPVNLDLTKVPADVVAALVQGGAKVILTNAFNGGGKELDEASKLAQMQKRMDAWYRGEYVVIERDNAMSGMREAYVDETRERTGQTLAQVEKDMAALVKSTFGEKEKVTFGRFLQALAKAVAKERKLDPTDVEAKLAAKYARLADEAAKRRASASAKLDLSGISLD